ncbi:AMP-binding protein [Bradyrhizobium liaoningense]
MFPALDWVSHHALTKPRAVALRNYDDSLSRTWAELEPRVGRLASGLLKEWGLRRGDRVALLSNGDLRFFELQFACMRAGLIIMPLNFRLTPHELAGLCREMNAAMLVNDAAWQRQADEVATLANIERRLSWGAPDSAFDRMAEEGDVMVFPDDIGSAHPTHILFTSGTTGKTKGAYSTHGTLIAQALNQVQFAGVAEAGAHVFVPIPLFHAGGLTLANPILYFGGQVTIAARFDPAATARVLGSRTVGITHLALVPLMYRMIADTAEFADLDLSGLRVALVAGGRLPPELLETYARKGINFTSQYGGTETGPTITALDPARVDKALAGSCGQKAKHVEIRLMDTDGKDVPEGQPGEIWVRGPAITPSYIGRPRDMDFTGDWFRTGDVARRDAEGFYYIVDRVKDMYKSGGENVSSVEVEEILIRHPSIAEVAVIGTAHEKWGEVGLAVVVLAAGGSLTLGDIEEFCDGRLARFKQPKALKIVEALPRNVTGKIAKAQLRDMFGGTRSA